jgi:predicted Zn-dependent protease
VAREKFRDAAALWFARACALRYGITMAILRSATVILLSTVSSVIAQDLMATDQQLGLNHHQQVLAHYQLISQGQIYERLQRVFTRITQTPDFNGGANLRYQLFYLDSSEINAYSVGGGTMYVTAGLMQAIQGNEGVLAFVMGHEMFGRNELPIPPDL